MRIRTGTKKRTYWAAAHSKILKSDSDHIKRHCSRWYEVFVGCCERYEQRRQKTIVVPRRFTVTSFKTEVLSCSELSDMQPIKRRGRKRRFSGRGTYLLLYERLKDESTSLALNIHPADVEAMKIQPRTSYYLSEVRSGSILTHHGEGDLCTGVLAFVKNTGATKSPKVSVSTTGWGIWKQSLDKETVEERIRKGRSDESILAKTEVVAMADGTPVLLLYLQPTTSDNCSEEVPQAAACPETHIAVPTGQRESEASIALNEAEFIGSGGGQDEAEPVPFSRTRLISPRSVTVSMSPWPRKMSIA